MAITQKIMRQLTSPAAQKLIAQRLHHVGQSGYDPWGFHPEMAGLGLTFCRWLYQHYFRVQTSGLEHIPAQGRCLIIANHSGQVFPIDGMMIAAAMAFNPHAPRMARAMAERFFPTTPYLGDLISRLGMTLGDPINCARMLNNEEAVLVFPEGERGFVKKPSQKYQLQRMGNGFIRLAVQHQAPIIPVGVVGCEELTLNFGREEHFAKRLGIPSLPLAIPMALPVKVYLNFGKAIYFPQQDGTNREYDRLIEEVAEVLRQLIQTGLEQRTSIF